MVEATTPPNPADGTHRSSPDPTLQTIDALRREVAQIEKSIENRFTAAADLEVERFRRIDELMGKAGEAMVAALEAQKEAGAKTERSISEQLSLLRGNFDTSLGGIRTSITDLKDRMTVLEAIKQGQTDQRTEARQSTAAIWAAVGVIVALFVAAFSVFAFVAGGGM